MNTRIFKKFVIYFAAAMGMVVGIIGIGYGLTVLSHQLTGTGDWAILFLLLAVAVFASWEFAKDTVRHEQFKEQLLIDRMQNTDRQTSEHRGNHQ
jgi:DMSO/TMAO reductase YedYZ heme-binding membrane subunit